MWVVHRVLRAGYSVLNRTGVFSTRVGRRGYEILYEQYKLQMERESIELLCSVIVPGSLVIDVGANIGIYTERFAARVGSSGRVLALEPDPTNAESLRRRFHHKPWVTVVEAAASDTTGTCHLAQDAHNPAGHALSDHGLEVRAVRIDDLVEEAALPLTAIKIDVEGAEPLVLRGAANSIRTMRPAILLEYSPARIGEFGVDPLGVLRQLEEQGYNFAIPPGRTPCTTTEVHEATRRKGYVDVLIFARALA